MQTYLTQVFYTVVHMLMRWQCFAVLKFHECMLNFALDEHVIGQRRGRPHQTGLHLGNLKKRLTTQ